MNTSLPMLSVGELISRGEADIQTGPFGTQLKASEYVVSGTPVINVRNVGFGDIRDGDLEYITEIKAEKLKAHQLRKGDIVFGRKGAVERHALISDRQDGWVQGSDCLRLRLSSQTVCERYVSYYFRTRAHQDWMQALCSFGATMASLNQDIVRRITIPFPSYATQRKIAAILTAYDDLIEVNKRRIALLENMAEEIYREWFVRMRFPGHQDTRFVKGVPEGWEVRELRECADVNPSSFGRNDRPSVIHYVDIGSVTTNNIGDIQALQLADAPGRAKRKVQHGDIIWSSVRPANRAYCLVYEPIENLIVSTGFAVIRPKSRIPFTFLNFVVTSNGFVDQMTAVAKGAAYPATSFDDFEKAKLLLPDEDTLAAFHENCEPLFQQKHTLAEQNRTLTKTRDLLLPRLISGKLSVEDLDIQFPPSMKEKP